MINMKNMIARKMIYVEEVFVSLLIRDTYTVLHWFISFQLLLR